MSVLTNNLDLFLQRLRHHRSELFLISARGVAAAGHVPRDAAGQPRAGVPRLRAPTYVTVVRNTPLTLVFVFFVFAYPLLEIVEVRASSPPRSWR